MTEKEFRTAKAIAEILKKQPDVAREIVNSFESSQHLFNALGIYANEVKRINAFGSGKSSQQLVPTLHNQRTF